jgi:phenylacetate-CoA ligase
VADCYAGREFGTIAYECEKGRVHVCETRFPEIIVKGNAANPGEMGEVALTSLSQYTMPFIRYKNDDMAIMDPEPCPCGRGLPVFKEIVGRIMDFLVSTEGKYIHSGYLMLVFNTRPEVVRFQAYQRNKRHLDIQLVCKETVTAAWIDEVKAEIQSCFGKDILVTINIVDHIELTRAGKHRFVISDVKPDFL